tara:strand:- start:13561 stop:14685 length:1125 start_codon:yes stop_codon:yes gene_type:complete
MKKKKIDSVVGGYIKSYGKESDILYIPHNVLGHTLAPNVTTKFSRKITEEDYHTNKYGWRTNNKKKYEKPDIFIAGDSNCLGTGNEFENTFGEFLSKRINKKIANLGVGGYCNLQAVRRIENNLKVCKPKLIIIIFMELMARSFQPNSLRDIVQRPYYRKNISSGDFILVKPRKIPLLLYKRYVKLEKLDGQYYKRREGFIGKLLLNNLNPIKKIEKILIWVFFQILNRKVENFFLNIFNLKKEKYVDPNDEDSRLFILKKYVDKLEKIIKKNKIKVLVCPIYPYVFNKVRKKKFYNDKKVLGELIRKKKMNNFYIDLSENLEKEHNLFFKKRKMATKNFYKELQWTDNDHPTPKGNKIIAKCIFKAMKKFSLI